MSNARSIVVGLTVGVVVVAPWALAARFLPGAPKWLWAVAACGGAVVLLGVFGRQWLASREGPVLVIDHAAGTLSVGADVLPLASIQGLECVRYSLRGQRVTSVGLRRLAVDCGPAALPRYRVLDVQASNLEELGGQIAQNLGVPIRTRSRGTIQGKDFVVR